MRGYPRSFMYLDEKGIESLYSQTVDLMPAEILHRSESDRSQGVKGRLALGRLLRQFLGLGEISGEVTHGRSRKMIEETKGTLTTEQKLRRLIGFLADRDTSGAFESFDLACRKCDLSKTALVLAAGQFN